MRMNPLKLIQDYIFNFHYQMTNTTQYLKNHKATTITLQALIKMDLSEKFSFVEKMKKNHIIML